MKNRKQIQAIRVSTAAWEKLKEQAAAEDRSVTQYTGRFLDSYFAGQTEKVQA